MSLDRDLQSKTGALQYDTLTVALINTPVYTAAIDTKINNRNSMRNLCAIVEPAAVLTGNIIRIIAEESLDGITWVDCSYKLLPTRHSTLTGQLVFDSTAPYNQVVGLQSSHRFVRFGLVADLLPNAPYAVFFNVYFETEEQDFLDYDPTLPVVPNDNLP